VSFADKNSHGVAPSDEQRAAEEVPGS
jgi:hypothetical protein